MHFKKKDLINRIKERKAKLVLVAKKLKRHFVGIDDVIDSIMKNIEVWYVMPEIMTRPAIVNLWGMTGVGKTDLVRRLVSALGFQDRFVEVQLTNKGASNIYDRMIEQVLNCSGISHDQQGVLLLDEIQRFRSVDEEGHEIHDYRFQDVWQLLSDGKFSGCSRRKQELIEMIFSNLYYEDLKKAEENDDSDGEGLDMPNDEISTTKNTLVTSGQSQKKSAYQRIYHQPYYRAENFKKMLKLKQPIEEIMKWSTEKCYSVLVKRMNSQNIYEGNCFSKLLIFISGNIDEAYTMSRACDEVDIDADIFHDYSLGINILSIKKALLKRFKPEQIARFGNSHIIYPSLSKKSFNTIINRRISELKKHVKKQTGINVSVDQSVKKMLYRNGVFPTQGVRPLLSTVSSMLESVMPTFILPAIERGKGNIKIYYKDTYLCSTVGDKTFSVETVGDIDKIKEQQHKMERIHVAVHEAGHSIAYACIFKIAPTQIIVDSSVPRERLGFTGLHRTSVDTKKMCIDKITVYCAGRVAEEKVFGSSYIAAGGSGDLSEATVLAGKMIRSWGMDDLFATIVDPHVDCDVQRYVVHDESNTDKKIEYILMSGKKKAEQIINNNHTLFKEVCDTLVEQGAMDNFVFQKVCKKHGLKIDVIDHKDFVFKDVKPQYDRFINDNKS